jgi:stage II sporulation protein M
MGIAHFEREYLLGREIDVINLRWLWNTFWKNFLGGAHSIGEWYGFVFRGSLRRMLPAVLAAVVIAGAGIWLGYDWVMTNLPQLIARASPEELAKIQERASQLPDLASLRNHISAPFLFFNNARAVVAIFLAGLVSFSVLGVLVYIFNIGLLGGLFALFQLLGIQPLPILAAGILPHGIFEIPALTLGSAAMLYFGVALVTPQTGKSLGEVVIELLADWAKIYIGIVIPLLAIAAVIEAYITPVLLANVMK